MGCMSASDAAPLPRLGEVFFDVRGSSRSMRLSWYSDTGVAVFSIWQGGTCTGTFRLPIDDLPRMVEALQRGPRGAGPPGADARDGTGERPHHGLAAASSDPDMTAVSHFPDYATGQTQAPVTGEFRPPGAEDGPGFHREDPYRDRGPGLPEPSFQPSYPDETPAYRDDPLSTRPSGPGRRYRDSEPDYGDDPLGVGGSTGGYHRPDPYQDRGPGLPEPSFQPSYPDEIPPPAFRDDPLSARPGRRYRDSEPDYGDDPLGVGGSTGGYREDDPYQPSYGDEPPGAYPGDSRGRGYAGDPFPSVYPEDARDRGYRDDLRPGGSHPYGPPPARDDRDAREQRAPRGRS
jgi:hypothetical protein